MGRPGAVVSLASLVAGGALVLALQWLAGSQRPSGTPDVRMAVTVSQSSSWEAEAADWRDAAEDLERNSGLGESSGFWRAPWDSLRHRGRTQVIPGFGRSTDPQYARQSSVGNRLQTDATKGRVRSGPILGCEQFRSANFSWPKGMKTIAVVGNGPLREESRAAIERMDLVVRFNKLQSYRCGEKFDVWASRHGDAVSTRYWGIGMKLNITGCPLGELLRLAKHIWLLNGGDGPFHHFLSSFPDVQRMARYAWLDCRTWVAQYLERHDPKRLAGYGASSQDEVSPSSGWLVLSMLAECAPRTARIHVFGFNWPGGQWPAHKVESEKAEIMRMAERGVLHVHETQCKHKYHCDD